jgi:hypothetical protein
MSAIRLIAAFFGYRIMYEDHRGMFRHRYDAIDFHMVRPIHEKMSVAYPSAKLRFVRIEP